MPGFPTYAVIKKRVTETISLVATLINKVIRRRVIEEEITLSDTLITTIIYAKPVVNPNLPLVSQDRTIELNSDDERIKLFQDDKRMVLQY